MKKADGERGELSPGTGCHAYLSLFMANGVFREGVESPDQAFPSASIARSRGNTLASTNLQ